MVGREVPAEVLTISTKGALHMLWLVLPVPCASPTLPFQLEFTLNWDEYKECYFTSMQDNIESKSVEEHITTTIVDDGLVDKVHFGSGPRLDPLQARYESCLDFLAKPYLLGTYVWTVADPAGTNYANIPLASNLTSNSFWSHKLEGFGLVRGTAVVRLVLNASPFFCGQLIMYYLPNYAQFATLDPSYVAMQHLVIGGLSQMSSVTQHPHIVCCCDNSAVEFRIPYIAPYDWLDIKRSTYDWGTVFVDTLAPLLTGVANPETAVEFSMYLYFEDMELAAPMVTQSSSARGPRRAAGGKVLLDTEVQATGPVSSSLRALSDASSALGRLPGIGPVLGQPAWALAAASKAADAFGWGKPISEHPSEPKFEQGNKFGATSDGVDMAVPLALSTKNRLRMTDQLSIYNGDELALDFLLPREALINTFTWTTSNISTYPLYVLPISPGNLYAPSITKGPISGHSTVYGIGPPVCYLSKMFQYWRGSINLRFVFVKTKFHTGRVQITYTPAYNYDTTPTVYTSILALREIVDLKTGEEVRITLPYMLAQPWLSTQTNAGVATQNMGVLEIDVLNELRVPEATATNTVSVLVYASAGPDFEFAGPSFSPGGVNGGANSMLAFSPQMGCEEIMAETIAGASGISVNNSLDEYTFGERITSLKQILNRAQLLANTTAAYGAGSSNQKIWPWFNTVLSMNSSTGVLQGLGFAGGDAYAFIRPMFAYYRGSVRIQNWNNGGDLWSVVNTEPASLGAAPFTLNPANPPIFTTSFNGWVPTATQGTIGSNGVYSNGTNVSSSYKIPYYCPTKMSLCLTSQTLVVPNEASQPTTFYYTGGYSNSTAGLNLRSFADDFQLTFFLGCPPFFISWS
jgi:hypothetical protein